MAMLAAARGRGPWFERPAGVVRPVGGLERDRVVAEGVADVVRGIVIGGPKILLAGVGQKTLPARIDGFELREVLDAEPELGAVAAHQGQAVDETVETAELAEFVEKEGDPI